MAETMVEKATRLVTDSTRIFKVRTVHAFRFKSHDGTKIYRTTFLGNPRRGVYDRLTKMGT
jgi:hypothetical protein